MAVASPEEMRVVQVGRHMQPAGTVTRQPGSASRASLSCSWAFRLTQFACILHPFSQTESYKQGKQVVPYWLSGAASG
jgi:hypothetical protein